MPTRKKSNAYHLKQEQRIADDFKQFTRARTFSRSGATHGQNDILASHWEVEAKHTAKGSYGFSASYWKKVKVKCALNRLPLMVVEFTEHNERVAILDYEYLMELLEFFHANQNNEKGDQSG